MVGISSRAAGDLENKKKYNGIEFDNDLDINEYEAFFRELDPQIGRWWQIDPKIDEEQESMSPYTSMANDPVLKSDPLGDIAYVIQESSESGESPCCGVAALSKAGNTWRTTQKIAGAVELIGGGPEDPVADVVAGAIELVGGIKALWELFTVDEPAIVAPTKPSSPTSTPETTTTTTTTATTSAPSSQTQASTKKETGSYTNVHQSGTKYHGKGDRTRATESGKQKAKENNDPLVSTNWTKAKSDRAAFKQESKRLQKDGGAKSKTNYNKRDSPGTKYRKKDVEN